MNDGEAIQSAANELGIVLPEKDHSLWRAVLIERINHLLQHDFEKLVGILYRIDVSEKKLQQFLQQNTAHDTAPVIADLVIERQLQKIATRKRFHRDDPIDENEKW